MEKLTSTQIIAIFALAAILVAGGLYADKVYQPPEPPPVVAMTPNGPVILERRVYAGDLVTAPELKTIYYVNEEMKRVVFPDEQTFRSWYPDYENVKYLSREDLEALPLSGRNVTIRPGTFLITIPSSPQVWMIGAPRNLHWLSGGEEQVKTLFGENWSERLVDLPEYYFANYQVSNDIEGVHSYPVGQLIHVKSNDQYYLVTPEGQRQVTEEGMQANHLQTSFALEREEPVEFAQFGPPLTEYEPRWGSPDLEEQKADPGPEDTDVLGEEGKVL